MTISRISRHGNAHGITIPRAYLRQLQWAPGDHVMLEIVADRLQLTLVNPPWKVVLRPPAPAEVARAEGQA